MKMKISFCLLLCAMFVASMSMEIFPEVLMGTKTSINLSNIQDGYFDVKTIAATGKKIRVLVDKDGQKLNYDLPLTGEVVRYPLQLGDGAYNIKIIENIDGNKYTAIQNCNINVKLTDKFAPFLNANVYVDFNEGSNVVKLAEQVTAGCTSDLEKLDKIYAHVSELLTYDADKAATSQPDYTPVIDSVLESKKGICLDYAAIMAAMLRSQNIPTKLVTGYISPDNTYHAWVEVYIDDMGCIKTGEIYFESKTWKILDPTLMSSFKSSDAIQKFIGDSANYFGKAYY